MKARLIILTLTFLTSVSNAFGQSQTVRTLAQGQNDTTTVTLAGNATSYDCSASNLVWIDLSNAKNLRSLNCSDNLLDSLDVSMLEFLDELVCGNNNIAELAVDANKDLRYLDCSGNGLTSLDISANIKLQVLDCSNNQLEQLNTTANDQLRSLWASGNRLGMADLSACMELKSLNLADNGMAELQYSGAAEIEDLWLENNSLTRVDISNSSKVYSINVSNNRLGKMTWAGITLGTQMYLVDCSNNSLPFSSFCTASKVSNYICGLQENAYCGYDVFQKGSKADITPFITNYSGEKTTLVTLVNTITGEALTKGSGTADYQLILGNLQFLKEFEGVQIIVKSNKYDGLEIKSNVFAVEAPNAITTPVMQGTDGLSVSPGNGTMTLCAQKAMTVSVVSVGGQFVCTLKLAPNSPQTVSLQQGIYIVNGKAYKIN